MRSSKALRSLWLIILESSSEVSTGGRPWERGAKGALLFHCAYHVVLVTLYDISCFLSIISSVLSLCVFSLLHLLWFSALFIFTISARFLNIWLVCSLKPEDLNSCVGVDMHLSKYETWRSRETGSREKSKIQRKETQKENVVMESNWCDERQECQRGRRLALINDSVLIQHKHNLFLQNGTFQVSIINGLEKEGRGGGRGSFRDLSP